MQINAFKWDVAVSDSVDGVVSEAPRRGKHPLLVVLWLLVLAECGLMVVATVYLVFELMVATPSSFASAIALTVLTALAAVFLAIVSVNLLRGQAWVRGAIVTWQVLQIAVAVGCFQGLFDPVARPDLGWALLLPAIVVLVLLFTKPVIAATSIRE